MDLIEETALMIQREHLEYMFLFMTDLKDVTDDVNLLDLIIAIAMINRDSYKEYIAAIEDFLVYLKLKIPEAIDYFNIKNKLLLFDNTPWHMASREEYSDYLKLVKTHTVLSTMFNKKD